MLSLRAVRRLVQPGTRVLDVGCGSGVLAVAAMLLGAERAVGVDISPAAVPVTQANAAANGVEVDVSTTEVTAIVGRFDLVVANILAPVLIAIAPELRRLLAPRGALVISGVLAGHYDHVVTALAPLMVEREDTLDGWAAVTLRHG
jgi:ribosomal protein L11 methyltransferase